MIGSIIGAVLRITQLQKLMQISRVQAGYEKAKDWFSKQPREIQIVVGIGTLLVLGTVLFA
jgi:hypothetical protein